MGLDHSDHVAALRTEVSRIADALDRAGAGARVVTCGDWNGRDLAIHLAGIRDFWVPAVAEAVGRDAPGALGTPSSDVDHLGHWLAVGVGDLVELLTEADPDQPCWTWHPYHDRVGFVSRRMAHEFSIHRVDAQLAADGTADEVSAEVAADGIDEIFDLLGAGLRGEGGHGETVHLHGTDRDGDEWLVTVGPDRVTAVHEHAKGDLAVRATVSDLELVLYQRPPQGVVERFGDEAALAAFHRAFTF